MIDNNSINHDLEAKAESILSDYGIEINEAINYLFEKIINKEITANDFYQTTTNTPTKKYFKDLCGIWKGKVWMADDFNEPLECLREYME